MQVDHQFRESVVVTSLVGEFDTPVVEEAWEQLQEVKDFNPTGVVLDLSRCTYMASAGISVLVRLVRELRPMHVNVRIAAPSDAMKLVLETVNLEALIPVDGTVEAAVAKMRRKAVPVG